MGKVMVSLPDDLLTWIDQVAEHENKTRSGLLREFVDAEQRRRSSRRARRVREILAMYPPQRLEGVPTAVEALRADRNRDDHRYARERS